MTDVRIHGPRRPKKARQPGEKYRVIWTVPAIDTGVIAWLDAQASVNQSLRTLICNRIEQNGYDDAFFAPVRPLKTHKAGFVDEDA